jgi:putative NADH-flavin reductase
LLSTKITATALALAALWAAFVEVFQDTSPGGHHGAVLLATNELLELLEASRLLRGRLLKVLKNQVLRLLLVGGAAALALVEALAPMSKGKLGAHHGVVLLALSKTLRCVGLLRDQMITKKDEAE